MNIFEFMSLFSFSYILFVTIGIFILCILGTRRKRKALEQIDSIFGVGDNNEIKEDN